MVRHNKFDLFSVALRAGFIPSAVDDATFVSVKGSAAVEADTYFNTTSKLIRIYKNAAWSGLEADTLDGQHAAEIIATAIAGMAGVKRAWGWVASAATVFVNFNTGVISGGSGGYSGDTGFTQIPAVIVAHSTIDPWGQHGWDFGSRVDYSNLTTAGMDVFSSSNQVGLSEIHWLAVGR